MTKYQVVMVPSSSYRNMINLGIYMGKRPYDKAETVLMLNRDDPTTFVMRVLTNDEFKRLHDTGKNASEQIKAIIDSLGKEDQNDEDRIDSIC